MEDDKGVITVRPRATQGEALRWGIALITNDEEKIHHLRWIEAEEEYVK